MKIIQIILFLAIPFVLKSQRNDAVIELVHKGIERSFIVHLPNGKSDEGPYPVVFVLHDGGSFAEQMMKYTGFNVQADREKFIVVYPDGYKHSWADGNGVSNADEASIDDVDFIQTVSNYISEKYSVDPKRIYACGLGQGGFLCQRLACELSNHFAAVASVCATMPKGHPCAPAERISIMLMNGTKDDIVPFAGGSLHFGRLSKGECLSTVETIAWWVKQFDYTEEFQRVPVEEKIVDQITAEQQIHFSKIGDSTGLELVIVFGGGHTWPGKEQYVDVKFFGPICKEFDGNEMIWEFFKKCSRP